MKRVLATLFLLSSATMALGQVQREDVAAVREDGGPIVTTVQSFSLDLPDSFTLTGSPCNGGACALEIQWTDATLDGVLVGDGTDFDTHVLTDCNAADSALTYDTATQTFGCNTVGGGVTTADYLVGTTQGGLSAEIVVGTSPGGELGNTWASPTIDDNITVSGWTLSSPTITTPTMTYTKNIMLYPSRAQFLATAFPQYAVFAGSNFPVESLKYDTTTEEAAFWQFEAEGYSTGNPTLTVYWYADTSTTAAATVEWELSITAITGDSDTTNVETDTLATSQVQSDTLGTTDAQKLQITTVTITNLDSIAAGDLIFLRLSRNVGGTDDMAGDAQVIQAKFSYTAAF